MGLKEYIAETRRLQEEFQNETLPAAVEKHGLMAVTKATQGPVSKAFDAVCENTVGKLGDFIVRVFDGPKPK